MSGRLPRPVLVVVLSVAIGGLGSYGGVALQAGDLGSQRVSLLDGDVLVIALILVGLAALSEVAGVSLTHGEESEDLAMLEAAAVGSILLLPPVVAALVPALGVGLGSLVLRRAVHKIAFNLGWVLVGTAVLVAVHAVVLGGGQPLGWRSVLGVLLGMAGFVTVNLVAIALILRSTDGTTLHDVLFGEWRLSLLMGAGNGGMALITVSLATHDPVLVPFAAVPVLAILHAYRSYVEKADQRRRTGHLLEASAALLGSQTGSAAFLEALPSLARALGAQQLQLLAPELGIAVASTTEGARAIDGAVSPTAPDTVVPLGSEGTLAVRGAPVDNPNVRQLLTSVTGLLSSALRAHSNLEALRRESAKLGAVIDHSAEGIVVWEGDGSVLLWSPAAAKQTGYSAAAITSLPGDPLEALCDLIAVRGVDGAPLTASALRSAVGTKASGTTLKVTIRRSDGEDRDLRIALALAPGERVGRRVVAICHDITAQRRLDQLKEDFVATVSHELRTPLTPIKGYAKLLANRGDDLGPERRTRAVRLIEEGADHLARLVDDLLLASRVSDAERRLDVDLRSLDARVLVHAAVDAFPSLVGRIHVQLPDEPALVIADATRVRQCITNLLANSEKYSDPAQPISVSVSPDDGGVNIAVTDRGRGIPEDEIEQIFERFHRVEGSLTASTGGSGLGLYIARSIAQAMGGGRTCTSRLGVGSTFTLRLPAADAEASQPVIQIKEMLHAHSFDR